MVLLNKLSYRFLKLKFQVLSKMGIHPKFKKGGVAVLNYHGVVDSDELRFNSRFISTKAFEEQLTYFSTHFNVVSLKDVRAGKNLVTDKFNVALTFDDGLQNNFTHALPILKKFGIPATFCICSPDEPILWSDLLDISCTLYPDVSVKLFDENWTLGIGGRLKQRMITASRKELTEFHAQMLPCFEKMVLLEEFAPFWRLASEAELAELKNDSLFDLVAHGKNHLNSTALSLEEVRNEVNESIETIKRFGGDPTWFCYPNGIYSEETISLLKSLGVEHQIIVDSNGNYSDDLIARFVVNPHITTSVLLYFLARGHYGYR